MQYVIFIVLAAGLAAGLYLWIDTGNAAVLKVLAVWVIVVIFMLTGIPSAKKNEDGYVDLDDIPGRPPKRPLPPQPLPPHGGGKSIARRRQHTVEQAEEVIRRAARERVREP